MVFGRNFCEKRQILVSESQCGEVMGNALPWLMARWKAHDQLSVRFNWTFLAIYYASVAMRRNVYSSAVCTGSTSLHSNFTWTGSSFINHSWRQKLETLGYRWWRPHPSAFYRFDTILECDGRTDGQNRQTGGRIWHSINSASINSSLCGAL